MSSGLNDEFVEAHVHQSGQGAVEEKLVRTLGIDAGELSLPSRPLMEQSLDSWRRAGLPEFGIPKRLAIVSTTREATFLRRIEIAQADGWRVIVDWDA